MGNQRASEAWIHGYEELSLAAGKAGDANGALSLLAEQARIPLPAPCVLGAVIFGERSMVVMRDQRGDAFVQYEGHLTTPNIDVAHLVPEDFKSRLLSCDRVDVLASPLLRGRLELLPRSLPWATHARHVVQTPSARCEAHQLEARDARPASEAWRPQFFTGPSEFASRVGRTVLWGSSLTPTALLEDMPKATEISIAATTTVDGAASLLLSPDKNNKSLLTLEDLQGVELTCAPLVVLLLNPAEATLLEPYAPRLLADTLIERGARAVFLVKGPVAASEVRQFFGMLFARINAGAPAAEVLRDLRSKWAMWNWKEGGDWVDNILLFE
jgi:hypothetical protein